MHKLDFKKTPWFQEKNILFSVLHEEKSFSLRNYFCLRKKILVGKFFFFISKDFGETTCYEGAF